MYLRNIQMKKKDVVYSLIIIVILIISFTGRSSTNQEYIDELDNQIQELKQERKMLIDSVNVININILDRENYINDLQSQLITKDNIVDGLKQKEVELEHQLDLRLKEIEFLTARELQDQIISRYVK